MLPWRRLMLATSLAAGVVVIAGCSAASSSAQQGRSGAAAPTATTGPCAETSARLGALTCAFTAIYGSPTQTSLVQRVYAAPGNVWLQVSVTADGPTGRVDFIDAEDASGGALGAGVAQLLQGQLVPADARFSDTQTDSDGVSERVYTSGHLATLLPASDFTSHNAPVGTFSVETTPAGGLSLFAGW